MATVKVKKIINKPFSTNGKKVVEKSAKKSATGKNGVKITMHTIQGETSADVMLPEELFAAHRNKILEAQAVRVYLANQRAGSAATKTRGSVAGSTRKIYRQKGTGKARHGGIRAPIFVGGGIAFGPQPRDYSLAMPQKMRRLALGSSLTSKLESGDIIVVEDLNNIHGKTKEMAEALVKLDAMGSVLMVLTESLPQVKLSVRNLAKVTITNSQSLNAYEVLKTKSIIFAKEAIAQFGEKKN